MFFVVLVSFLIFSKKKVSHLILPLSGVARGGGWQHLGAYVNLGAFYLVGIPVALFFGFTMQLRGMGFWIGMIAGGATQVTLLSVITATTKWDKMVSSFSILCPILIHW